MVHSCFSSRALTSASISALRSRADSTQMGGASGSSPAAVRPPESCKEPDKAVAGVTHLCYAFVLHICVAHRSTATILPLSLGIFGTRHDEHCYCSCIHAALVRCLTRPDKQGMCASHINAEYWCWEKQASFLLQQVCLCLRNHWEAAGFFRLHACSFRSGWKNANDYSLLWTEKKALNSLFFACPPKLIECRLVTAAYLTFSCSCAQGHANGDLHAAQQPLHGQTQL